MFSQASVILFRNGRGGSHPVMQQGRQEGSPSPQAEESDGKKANFPLPRSTSEQEE